MGIGGLIVTSYHNTTDSVQPDLGKYEKKAKSQEDQILEWFKTDAALAGVGKGFSPSVIKAILFLNTAPLTSIRRAMTNLTNRGELVKSDRQRKGPFGRPEYEWRLAEKYSQRSLF